MANAKTKTEPPQYRDGTLGWWLMEAGWEPVPQDDCLRGGKHKKAVDQRCEKCREFIYPLWRLEGFEKLLTGWEARRLELLRIHNEFKMQAKGTICL